MRTIFPEALTNCPIWKATAKVTVEAPDGTQIYSAEVAVDQIDTTRDWDGAPVRVTMKGILLETVPPAMTEGQQFRDFIKSMVDG